MGAPLVSGRPKPPKKKPKDRNRASAWSPEAPRPRGPDANRLSVLINNWRIFPTVIQVSPVRRACFQRPPHLTSPHLTSPFHACSLLHDHATDVFLSSVLMWYPSIRVLLGRHRFLIRQLLSSTTTSNALDKHDFLAALPCSSLAAVLFDLCVAAPCQLHLMANQRDLCHGHVVSLQLDPMFIGLLVVVFLVFVPSSVPPSSV